MPISAKDVSLIYSPGTPFETAALKNVGFTVEDGEFVGIMGHTGSGKSTVLQLMAGLLTPTSGVIEVDGRDICDRRYDRSELRKKVGVVFQYPECQLFEATVEKDVAFGLRYSGLSGAEIADRVKWALEIAGFDFEKVRKVSPLGLSGGEKRRAAIAGVLAAKPKYLLLDEPIAGLDPLGREAFLELLRKLNADGATIVMVSHNADSLGECARRILIFDHGRLAEDGGTREIFRDVEKMKARALGVSQSREIACLLQKGGMDIPQDITDYGALKAAVLRVLKGGDLS